ncbi:hypothetical protein RND71_018440 [Anisodus tanguticus]|uniref:Uncharacterized protein n=1 Tax=Anisodus tanguticus TaxID=243964 RepID=A0AAE1S5E0_9SOLA|nr:hypothetical protein RND71_018440 [Anisodus tanguticus]
MHDLTPHPTALATDHCSCVVPPQPICLNEMFFNYLASINNYRHPPDKLCTLREGANHMLLHISNYLASDQRVAKKMEDNGCLPDNCTSNLIVHGFLKSNKTNEAMALLKEIVVRGFPIDKDTVEMLLKLGNDIVVQVSI